MSVAMLAFGDFPLLLWYRDNTSTQGLGAIFSQINGGQERIITYAKQSLHATERNPVNYSSFRFKLLALVQTANHTLLST